MREEDALFDGVNDRLVVVFEGLDEGYGEFVDELEDLIVDERNGVGEGLFEGLRRMLVHFGRSDREPEEFVDAAFGELFVDALLESIGDEKSEVM
jgi:hypothetical protein